MPDIAKGMQFGAICFKYLFRLKLQCVGPMIVLAIIDALKFAYLPALNLRAA